MQESTTPYGIELANKVAHFLEAGGYIAHDHRDYCGMGLVYDKEHFVYASVNDGYGFYIKKAFPTREEFTTWLAAQSDESLSGKEEANPWLHGNQRLNQKRFENLPDMKTLYREGILVIWEEYE